MNLEPTKEQVNMLRENDIAFKLIYSLKIYSNLRICNEFKKVVEHEEQSCINQTWYGNRSIEESQVVSDNLESVVLDMEEPMFNQITRSQWSAGHISNVKCPSTLHNRYTEQENTTILRTPNRQTSIQNQAYAITSENKFPASSEANMNRSLKPILYNKRSSNLNTETKIFLSPNMSSSSSNPTQEENIQGNYNKYLLFKDTKKSKPNFKIPISETKSIIRNCDDIDSASDSDSKFHQEIASHCLLNEKIILDTSNILMQFDKNVFVDNEMFVGEKTLIEFAKVFFFTHDKV